MTHSTPLKKRFVKPLRIPRTSEKWKMPMPSELSGGQVVAICSACGSSSRTRMARRSSTRPPSNPLVVRLPLPLLALATELIKGKSTSEALALSGVEMAADLGPLPPTKIHCHTMVEDALRSAIAAHEGGSPETKASEPSTKALLSPLRVACWIRCRMPPRAARDYGW